MATKDGAVVVAVATNDHAIQPTWRLAVRVKNFTVATAMWIKDGAVGVATAIKTFTVKKAVETNENVIQPTRNFIVRNAIAAKDAVVAAVIWSKNTAIKIAVAVKDAFLKFIVYPTVAAIKWTWKTLVATVKFCNKKFWEGVYFTVNLINKYVASERFLFFVF